MKVKKEELMEELPEPRRVWVGEKDRIASFHSVNNYELRTFTCQHKYIKFLRDLQKRGFRFQ